MILRPRGKGKLLIDALALLIVLAIVFQTLNVSVANAQYTPQHSQGMGFPSSSASAPAEVNPQCYSPYYEGTYYYTSVSARSDKQTYRPGETVTLSGTVTVSAEDIWNDGCGNEYSPTGEYQADPSVVYVNTQGLTPIAGAWATSSGFFSFTYTLPSDTPTGPFTFRLIAIVKGHSFLVSDMYEGGAYAKTTVTITIAAIPLSVTLTVTPLSGQAPFTPDWSIQPNGGQGSLTIVIDYGDGTITDVSTCGKSCPAHTYTAPGTYTITATVTDSTGAKASDSKTITVLGPKLSVSTMSCPTPVNSGDSIMFSATVSASDGSSPTVTYAWSSPDGGSFDNAASPTPTWNAPAGVTAPTNYVIYLKVSAPGYTTSDSASCTLTVNPAPAINLIPAIWIILIFIIVVMLIFRWRRGAWPFGRRVGGPPPPPPQLFPPNVTGRAQLTRSDGTRIDLTRSNLNDVGPGTSVNTEKSSFVRISTPKTTLTNSHSVVGENSSLSWLDPRPYLPWLKLPYASLGNVERLLLQPNFGKLLLNWMETDASQEALLVLPAGLIGVAAADETRRWLARVKGTMLLVEANENRTTAAITVLEDPTKPGSVELWRSDDTGKVIEIHSGERVILKTGQPPTKMTVNFAPGLTQQIQDPFNVLHRWWTLPPASDESLTALETPSMGSKLSTGMTAAGSPPPQNAFCSECGQALPKPNSKFCTKCGAAQGNAGDVGKCRKCGEPLRPGKKFCMKCGTPTGQS